MPPATPTDRLRPSPDAAPEWPLAGRDEALPRAVTALQGRSGRGVVIAGPAGVGKTRLARAAVDDMVARFPTRFEVKHAAATRSAAVVPFGPLAALLDPEDDAFAGADGGGARLRPVVDALARSSARREVVLFVDDAHLLDPLSAAAIHRVVQEGTAKVLLTVRSDRPAPDAVVALAGDDGIVRVDLGPLDLSVCTALVDAALGAPIDGAGAQRLWERSGGNPLHLRELLHHALATGGLADDGGIWFLRQPLAAVPRISDLVAARLAELDDDERDALEVVALGEPLLLELVPHVMAIDRAVALERKGLLAMDGDGEGRRLRMAQPLDGEVLRADCPPLRRSLIHRRLADAAAMVAGSGRLRERLQRACWRLEGGGPIDPGEMLDAARCATAVRADGLALRCARAAWRSAATFEATLVLAECLNRVGRHIDADDLVAERLDDELEPRERALATMLRGHARFWGLGRAADALAALETAEQTVAGTTWAEDLAAQRATFLTLSGRLTDGLAVAEPLLALDRVRPRVGAAVAAAPALALLGRAGEAVAVAEQGFVDQCGLGELPTLDFLAHPGIHIVATVLAHTESGDLTRAERQARGAYRFAVGEQSSVGQAWFALLLGRIALLQGRLADAAQSFGEARVRFHELELVGPWRWSMAGIMLAAAQRGHHELVAHGRVELDAVAPGAMLIFEPDVERARAWADLAAGDPEAANARFVRAAEQAERAGARTLAAALWHDLARSGQPDAALGIVEVARGVEGDLTRGRAAHVRALVDGDAEALDRVASGFEEIGAWLFAAEAAAGSAAIATRAGARRRAAIAGRRSEDLVARCQGACTPALGLAGSAAGLTGREEQVATMAAAGATNREIAERLSLSVRTVENHLQRAYEKLGVAGRGALAAALSGSPPGGKARP